MKSKKTKTKKIDMAQGIKVAFNQMSRSTALDIRDDYREIVSRLRSITDSLAGAFVVASGDSAAVLEAELRIFEDACEVLRGSMMPEVSGEIK